MKRALYGVAALVCVSLTGYPQNSFAMEMECDKGTFDGAIAGEVVVPQNWNCRDRQEFRFTDQGSQIIPYVWFLHLEQAGSTAKFAAPVNMNRFRYLPQKPTKMNPDGLPIGFTRGNARDSQANGKISWDWLGITCAACHTGQVEYNGAKFLIDGAPTMGDFETLLRDLVKAMKATVMDDGKFKRFATAVITDSRMREDGGTGDKNQLRLQLKKMIDIRDDWNRRNQGTAESGDYGHARLDAVGAIVNEVAAAGLGKAKNIKAANAPVSYPFIWDTPQHDKVQWNGSVFNAGLGALSRNVGEVVGVFGALNFSKEGIPLTSINFGALAKLETLLTRLQSPLWKDTDLPDINQTLARKGRGDFEDFCIGCHLTIKRDDPDRHILARMFRVTGPNGPGDSNSIATDDQMALNFLLKTRAAKGRVGKALFAAMLGGLLRDPVNLLKAIKAGQPSDVVAFVYKAKADHLPGDPKNFLKALNDEYPSVPDKHNPHCVPNGTELCYKARPLNGIWATAPFLHNGSVRTMRQLLLPADLREKSFKVGTREYDPDDMGFKDVGAFALDTSLPGNSNAGHDGRIYGSKVFANDKERMNALLEYLKTL
jgi:hypothetical protein